MPASAYSWWRTPTESSCGDWKPVDGGRAITTVNGVGGRIIAADDCIHDRVDVGDVGDGVDGAKSTFELRRDVVLPR